MGSCPSLRFGRSRRRLFLPRFFPLASSQFCKSHHTYPHFSLFFYWRSLPPHQTFSTLQTDRITCCWLCFFVIRPESLTSSLYSSGRQLERSCIYFPSVESFNSVVAPLFTTPCFIHGHNYSLGLVLLLSSVSLAWERSSSTDVVHLSVLRRRRCGVQVPSFSSSSVKNSKRWRVLYHLPLFPLDTFLLTTRLGSFSRRRVVLCFQYFRTIKDVGCTLLGLHFPGGFVLCVFGLSSSRYPHYPILGVLVLVGFAVVSSVFFYFL